MQFLEADNNYQITKFRAPEIAKTAFLEFLDSLQLISRKNFLLTGFFLLLRCATPDFFVKILLILGPRKPSQKLFIGNIAEGTTNEQLKSVFERFAGVIEADVIKNYGFVHIDANAGRQKVNEIIRELNGYNLNGNSIRVQMSTSGVRQRPGMGGDQCYRYSDPRYSYPNLNSPLKNYYFLLITRNS